MLSKDKADCLALANTAILLRLIEHLNKCNIVAMPGAVFRDAVSDLENCPEQSSRVDDAIRLIKNELMPRFAKAA